MSMLLQSVSHFSQLIILLEKRPSSLPTSTMMLQICVFLGSKTKHGNYNYSMDVIQLVSAFQDTLPSQELGMCVPLLLTLEAQPKVWRQIQPFLGIIPG